MERRNAPLRITGRVVGALQLATLIVCCVAFAKAPVILLVCYLAGGVVSFLLYRADKQAAINGSWRIPEGTLHLVDLVFFGVVGGLLAQGVLRHKSSKMSFGIATTCVVAVHVAALVALLLGYLSLDVLRELRL